jgi:hypothetical protein
MIECWSRGKRQTIVLVLNEVVLVLSAAVLDSGHVEADRDVAKGEWRASVSTRRQKGMKFRGGCDGMIID